MKFSEVSMGGRLALVWLLVLMASCVPPPPKASNGILDLRGWDWHGAIDLVGPWKLGTEERLVPDHWNGAGAGTYRLRVLLPEGHPPLQLQWTTASTAMIVRAEGTEVGRAGTPSLEPSETVPAYAPGTARLPDGPSVDLEVFVSNHVYRSGGLWRAPRLGPVSDIEAGRWGSEMAATVLAALLTVVGVSALLLFVLKRTELLYLELALFSLATALRPLVTDQYVLVKLLPSLPFDLLIRLEYVAGCVPVAVGALFFSRFFQGLWSKALGRWLVWPSWLFLGMTALLPLEILTRSITFYYPFVIFTLVTASILVSRRILKEGHGYWLLAGLGVLVTAGLADVASAALLIRSGNFLPWGLALMVIFQANAMARRFIRDAEKNETLLAEKELLVKEIHHRVKNSLQIVASLVSLQANRLNDPQQKAVFRALRQRITAIALVHEKLYGRGLGTGRPELGGYLRDLLTLQYPSDGLDGRGIRWNLETVRLETGVDFCVDAGLILTELAGNALKHGLGTRPAGRMNVTVLVRDQRLHLEVDDDGPGFPEGFEPESSSGLGFRLVLALLQRNDGTIHLGPGPGGQIRVELRLPPN